MAGLGYKDFTAGAVLTAAQVDGYLMEQAVMNFAGTAARGSALSGVVAAGMVAHVGAGTLTVYDGSNWQQVYPASQAALVLISSTTIGSAVSSVTVSNCFSATYDNYKIVISGGVASTTSDGNFTLGSSTAGYYNSLVYNSYNSATPAGVVSANNAASTGTTWAYSANGYNLDLTLYQPFATKRTSFTYLSSTIAAASTRWSGGGFHDVAASYTSITFTTQSGHTLTGGTIKVYGIGN